MGLEKYKRKTFLIPLFKLYEIYSNNRHGNPCRAQD